MSDPELERILRDKAKKIAAGTSQTGAPAIVALTASDFEGRLSGGKPIFVDFWAVWCGPCRVMEPVVEKLAAKYSDKLVFGKLNVDEQPEIATRYEVQSIPTFMIFKKGQPADAVIGAVGEAALEQMIQRSIGGQSIYR